MKQQCKKKYSSRKSTLKHIDELFDTQRIVATPYKCSKCKFWHIRENSDGVAACLTKTAYRAEVDAKNSAFHIQMTYQKNLKPYRCSFCDKWHLTSKG